MLHCDNPNHPCECYDCMLADSAQRDYERHLQEQYERDMRELGKRARRDEALAFIESANFDDLSADSVQRIAGIICEDEGIRAKQRPFWEVECTCGECLLIACDDGGCVTDGTGVDCPGCGHSIQVTCGPETEPYWQVNYKDAPESDTLCATYCEGAAPDGCELMGVE